MGVHGQFFGTLHEDQKDTSSPFWLQIDPDESEGFVLIRHIKPERKVSIASVRISIGPDGDFILRAGKSARFETEYNIKEDCLLASDFSATASIAYSRDDSVSTGTWKSGNRSGTLEFGRETTGDAGEPQQRFSDWDSFKGWANKYTTNTGCAFRGQGADYPLCTSFHRTGRVNLVRYIRKDLPMFVDYLETVTGQRYNLADSQDFGSVIGLAQHYGFPSPLLDWTQSPYVAAYFAFTQILGQKRPPSHVRIFRLNEDFVRTGIETSHVSILDTELSISTYRPQARGNGRLLNQQGLFLFSNVVDIEYQLRKQENKNVGSILEIVDVASDQATKALADLRNMGTTAATLFPGLDGAATYLKHLLFYPPAK